MERSSENNTARKEQPEQRMLSSGTTGVKKEREPKEDGRYIIFYEFEDENAGEDAAP